MVEKLLHLQDSGTCAHRGQGESRTVIRFDVVVTDPSAISATDLPKLPADTYPFQQTHFGYIRWIIWPKNHPFSCKRFICLHSALGARVTIVCHRNYEYSPAGSIHQKNCLTRAYLYDRSYFWDF
jgi:hypothetical protein